ncbi:MAG TPA: WhiB family transcriptional regulator [Acidimicrobiia bacterium]|jgi:WhiB family redox-sensing transcriptional regulator|nr:WhiB family transcriptional regulator [Acidimicrobiia bacterium]
MNELMRDLEQDGRCTKEGRHELFFSDKPAELAQAQAICAGCSVRVSCLELALRENMEWGVWGGVIFWDGQPYHRRRGRGRPSSADAHLPLEADRGELLELVRSA